MKREGEPDPVAGPEGPGELGEVAAFAEDLRMAFPETAVPPARQEAHLAAIVQAAGLLADKGESTLGSTSKAHGLHEGASGLPKPRRKPVFKTRTAKIGIAAAIGVMSLGGLATAGALPGPVQHTVASMGSAVGIDLPDPNDAQNNDAQVGEPDAQNNDAQGQSGDQGNAQGQGA